MKGIHSVACAVIATMTLVACSADPLGPASDGGRPSLSTGETAEVSAWSIGPPMASDQCVSAVEDDEVIISGSSTYIVAYDENLEGCVTSPTDTTSSVTLPPPDSIPSRPTIH